MARSTTTTTARSRPRQALNAYTPPTPLLDLHILDVLELAGSQYRAGRVLSMHQSTVCRSLQLMQSQFRLVPGKGSGFCRYGHNPCLHYLRMAYREHRLMGGLLRIGSDGLHQPLLAPLPGIQQVPARFRSGDHWAELVRLGLLDGALVSSFCLEQVLQPEQKPQWEGLAVVPLGVLPLELVATTPEVRRVLVPRKTATALLHQTLLWHGYAIEQQPVACQEPAAWIKRAKDRKLALPLYTGLLDSGWLEQHGLVPLSEQPDLIEQLWLVMPCGLEDTRAARHCLRQLQSRIAGVRTMRGLH